MRFVLALFTTTLAICALSAADDDAVAALAGGTALPAGTHTFAFPSMAKQSISFTSDADERIVGTIDFAPEVSLGEVFINADAGTGSGQISLTADRMRTGNDTRDQHMWSADWLDAAKHPTISFTNVTLSRKADTVYEVKGTWTIKGVAKEMTSLANVRFLPSFPRLGENIVRIRTSFDLPIKEFGLTHAAVGSPAVADVWTVDVTLLGIKQ